MRMIVRLASAALPALFALALMARPALGADLHVTLPNITAAPGGTIQVAFDLSANPTGLGIVSMEYVLPLNPVVIASSQSQSDGFLQFWGPPYVNGTSSFVAAAAAGLSALVTGTTRMNSVLLTLKPTAVPGTIMPLAFSVLRFNEGSPSVDVTPGSVTVSVGLAAPPPVVQAGQLALAAPWPNPARGSIRLACTLPARRTVRLSLHDVQGRCVRVFAAYSLAGGAHEFAWDGRDERGEAAPAGLYLARLSDGAEASVRRVVRLP